MFLLPKVDNAIKKERYHIGVNENKNISLCIADRERNSIAFGIGHASARRLLGQQDGDNFRNVNCT